VDDADEQEEERESHQRKKMHQRKKHQKRKHRKKHPEHESDENNGREKETTVKWVQGEKRKENDEVMRKVAVWKGKHRQEWGVVEDQ
jgi:hypothetical protein